MHTKLKRDPESTWTYIIPVCAVALFCVAVWAGWIS